MIVSEGLRRLTFAGVSCRAVDYQGIVNSMDKVNWEVKELMSQHSQYVDILLRVRKIPIFTKFYLDFDCNYLNNLYCLGLTNICNES